MLCAIVWVLPVSTEHCEKPCICLLSLSLSADHIDPSRGNPLSFQPIAAVLVISRRCTAHDAVQRKLPKLAGGGTRTRWMKRRRDSRSVWLQGSREDVMLILQWSTYLGVSVDYVSNSSKPKLLGRCDLNSIPSLAYLPGCISWTTRQLNYTSRGLDRCQVHVTSCQAAVETIESIVIPWRPIFPVIGQALKQADR